jgi:adenylate cyclase
MASDAPPPGDPTDPADPVELLLGAPQRLTREEVVSRAGVSMDDATALWGALGFPQPAPGERAFTERDVAALVATRQLHTSAGVPFDEALVMARVMGRSLARLAEGELDSIVSTLGLDRVLDRGSELVDELEELLVYVWRRHLAASVGRLAATPAAGGVLRAVGFVDLVGYTSRSRELDDAGLTALLSRFDADVSGAVVSSGGRVVKSIGDELMWVHDDPCAAADCALTLAEQIIDPPVRVGLAYGRTVDRGGDHFGPVVNLAARLTALARPGSVLADRQLAGALAEQPERFGLRQLRAVHVRGYDHLVATAVRRRPRAPGPG